MAKTLIERLRSGYREEFPLGGVVQDVRCLEAADEIERLNGLLSANGVDAGSEYICRCGLRREPKRQKPDF